MISKNKDELRSFYQQRLGTMRNKNVLSQQIVANLLQTPFYMKAKNIIAYYPTKNEVNIKPLLEKIIADGKNLFLPFLDTYEIGQVKKFSDLKKGNYEIMIPPKISIFNPSKNDIILIPGLAFDHNGYRLGHGKGWYDKFLIKHQQMIRIGLAFSEQITFLLPCEKHDQRVTIIISNEKILNVR